MSYHTISSQFGSITIVWNQEHTQRIIHRIFLSNQKQSSEDRMKNQFHDLKVRKNTKIIEIGNQIQEFCKGEDVHFDLGILNFGDCSVLQKKVILKEAEIPRGYISTYKRIAIQIGKPNASRVVGRALAENPFPIMIPCHRTIRSDGKLGGYQGGIGMKRILLEFEDIKFSSSGRVKRGNYWFDTE